MVTVRGRVKVNTVLSTLNIQIIGRNSLRKISSVPVLLQRLWPQDEMKKSIRKSTLTMPDNFEIVFSFDTTGSMYSCLEEVRKKLGEIVQDLKCKIPGIKIAIFAHGDYCDAGSSYVTKYINFTNDANSLCNFVRDVGRTDGGDAPECYELVMREVQEKLSWSTNSQKALVLIGDAPPHEASESQNYRHLDWREETVRLRDMDIKVYAVECNDTDYENFYQHIAARTFGYFMPLSNFSEVKALMMNICFREAGLGDGGISSPSTTYTPATAIPYSPPSPTPYSKPGVISDDEDDTDDDDINDAGLRCYRCNVSKLPNEYPSVAVTEKCKHFPGVCLRCVISYVKENERCPQDGCTELVDPNCQNIRLFQAILDRMFVDYGKLLRESRGGNDDDISVSTMNGDTAWIPYNANMTITDLKRQVEDKLGIKENQQKLLYNEITLKPNKAPGQRARLSDYHVDKNASISVIVPLYCIPESLDHVVFDLSWEFPKSNPDFLDASCFAFNKTEFIQVIDWNHSTNQYYLKGAVVHSAKNETMAGGRIGHQTIHVYMKRLPADVTHIYFTLSSWRSPNLSAFANPSLQFYEASDPSSNLCSTTFGHALSSQAVVMCYLVRVGSQWQIYECGSNGCVNGNSKRYNPIRVKMVELIKEDMES